MIEKVRNWLKRDLWSIDSKAMQKEIIDCHNIILALVDVVEQVKQDMFNCYDCSELAIYVIRDSASLSSFICENCIADWERDEIIRKLITPNALITADEKINEILGGEK